MRHHQAFHRRPHGTRANNYEHSSSPIGGDEDLFAPNMMYRMNTMSTDSVIDYLSDDESDSDLPSGCNLDVSHPVRQVICRMLDAYINDDATITELEFPSSLFCHERIFIRQQAQQRNLAFRTLGRGASRTIAVSKSLNPSLPSASTQPSKQLTLTWNNPQIMAEINLYLQSCPISAADTDLLQAKIQKTPSSLNDWFYCTLLRSGNPLAKTSDMKPRVPDRKFLTHEHFTDPLPIDHTPTRNDLLHLTENSKMIFLSGAPAIGKSIRICQYIHDDYVDKQWPVRILHSCTNDLGAHALSSLLASFNQSIDCFTFDQMSCHAEANSLISITTHEFLLHTLISGDYLLKSSLTHLIIDDAHKRSHTLDMLLAFLKDSQHKYRHLKIILLQSTIQYDTLVKYFSSVVTYNIDTNGTRTNSIEEVFLDRILTEIQRMDPMRCLSIESYGLQLLNHWCQLVEQASIQRRVSQTVISDAFRPIYAFMEQTMNVEERYLSDLIGQCFCNGLLEDFQSLIHFICQSPDKCNYQHPLTLVTPLMCLSMWSIKSSIELLLSMPGVLINQRAVNNFSASDFARKYANSETIDLLESSIVHEPLLLEQLLSLSNQNSTVDSSAATMKFYLQSRHCDSIVDYQLILSLISYNYQTRSDHILVFLPGPDDISILNELVLELKHAHQLEMEVHPIIDSLSPWPTTNDARSRLLILCDARCETSVPFRNVSCVIDTGVTREKCYHTGTSKLLPKYNWISRTSAAERKHRATVERGVCYRLYPHSLFDEKINENIDSEMARQPLLENIMQAKLFAWTNCSVAEFMLKLPFPPPFASVRAGISQLKSLDLFDKWEDLVDLGAYSLALPIVDLPYAMMIVYGHLFRCLQPILTIVSALTIGDPFQQSTSAHRSSLNTKQRLASQKNSDHFILQQLYKQWEQATNKKEFCAESSVNYFRMQRIDRFKARLTHFLVNINFSKFFDEDASRLNENADCWPLIQAILVRCLPQNLLTYDQKWLSARNEFIVLDRLSILNSITWNRDESIQFAVCDDLVRSTKGLFVGQYCTLIEQIVLFFFGTMNDTLALNGYQMNLSDHNLSKLRTKLNACLRRKLQSLGCDAQTGSDSYAIDLLIKIFSSIS